MIQATTPTFALTLPNSVNLSEAAHIYFTLAQGGKTIQKKDVQLTIVGQTVNVYLTQTDTLQFTPGSAKLQLNWTYASGAREASKPVTIDVTENLLKEVKE